MNHDSRRPLKDDVTLLFRYRGKTQNIANPGDETSVESKRQNDPNIRHASIPYCYEEHGKVAKSIHDHGPRFDVCS